MWFTGFLRKLGCNVRDVLEYIVDLERGVQASYDSKTLINMTTWSVKINGSCLF